MTAPSGARLPRRTAVLPAGEIGVRQAPDDVVVVDPRAGDILAQRLAVYGEAIEVEQLRDLRQQTAQAARVVEIFHQVRPGGPNVGDHRHQPRQLVEAVDPEVDSGAARHGDDVHDCVGGPAEGHVHQYGVVEGARGQERRRA